MEGECLYWKGERGGGVSGMGKEEEEVEDERDGSEEENRGCRNEVVEEREFV